MTRRRRSSRRAPHAAGAKRPATPPDPATPYRSIVEHAVEGMFQWSPDGRFLMANAALARMLGFDSPDELLRDRTDLERQHYVRPEQHSLLKKKLEQHAVVRGFEYQAYRKDGSRIWLSAHVRAVRDATGALRHYEGTVQDVTEQKAIQEALRDSRRRYETLVESAQDIIFTVATDGTLRSLNPAFEIVTGWNPGDWVGRDLSALIHPADLSAFQSALESASTGRSITVVEVRVLNKDREIVTLECTATPEIRDGRVLSIRGIARDITARRRAEELLAIRARQQAAVVRLGGWALGSGDLEALLDSAVSLVAETLDVEYVKIFELLGGGDELLLRAGLGWRDEAVTRLRIRVSDDSPAAYTLLSGVPVVVRDYHGDERFPVPAFLAEHNVVSGANVLIGALDRPFGVLGADSTKSRIFTPDDVNFLQAVANLLTAAVERRRGEEIRSQLLARAISAQEEERRRVAHELHDETGQALSAILVGLRTAEDAPTLRQARTLIHRLRDLTGDTVRDVGRIARGLRPSVLDDLGLLPALHRLAEDITANGGPVVGVVEEPGERLASTVEITLYRIVQEALANVLRHAHARTVRVSVTRRNGAVEAVVQDDGVGFDSATMLARSGRHESLGLVGMRERAALVGGALDVESHKDVGTTVTARLPLQP